MSGDKKLRGSCSIFAFDGKAYNLPTGSLYPVVKYLPKNSVFNPNYCSEKKKTNIFTNTKYIYNFKVDYINLFTSGLKKLEDVKYKDNISQTGKVLLLMMIYFLHIQYLMYTNLIIVNGVLILKIKKLFQIINLIIIIIIMKLIGFQKIN